MNPQNMINMVKKFTNQYGVNVTWQELEVTNNSRGIPVVNKSEITNSVKVLLLKEKFNPIKTTDMKISDINVIGLSQDYTRYIIVLPEINIKKDMVITDNHNMKWKLGVIDWFDVGGVSVFKQSALTEVN
jgi:hypothetical protein